MKTGNIINNNTDLVSISSSDLLANLPGDAGLISGARQLSVTPSQTGTNINYCHRLERP